MAGYVPVSYDNARGVGYDALLYCKTNIGGYFFDGFLSVQHSSTLTITKNPVQTGAVVVDNAFMNPSQLTMQIIVSDVHESLIPGQFEGGWRRHTNAWTILKGIQSNRIPVQVFTKLGIYENMLITELSADDSAETFSSLRANVKLEEIPVARVKKVKISQASQTTGGTEMGKVEANQIRQSILSMVMNGVASYLGYTGGE
jgi:hypothetical protein